MKCDVKIKNRVKRLSGQMQGVMNMMDQERDCEDIITQLSAIRSSVDKVIALITTTNLVETIESKHGIKLEDIEDALSLIVKSK